jgi:hypothetical protein
MRKDVPVAVLEMLAVPGLRPDKVLKLYKELGLRSLDELEQAANADRLRPVKKLGAALQSRMLQGIEIKRKGEAGDICIAPLSFWTALTVPLLMPRLRWRKAREAASK